MQGKGTRNSKKTREGRTGLLPVPNSLSVVFLVRKGPSGSPLEEPRGGSLVSWVPKWESAENRHFHSFPEDPFWATPTLKNLLMPLFLMGCFPVDFQEVKRPLRTKSGKRPIKVGKRPINKRKRPIKAKVLVGVSVGCLMGCFRAPPP